jgi:hypothetical protein
LIFLFLIFFFFFFNSWTSASAGFCIAAKWIVLKEMEMEIWLRAAFLVLRFSRHSRFGGKLFGGKAPQK